MAAVAALQRYRCALAAAAGICLLSMAQLLPGQAFGNIAPMGCRSLSLFSQVFPDPIRREIGSGTD